MGLNLITDIETKYTKAVKKFFDPYKEPEVYGLIEKITLKGFFLGRQMELMCSVSEPPM